MGWDDNDVPTLRRIQELVLDELLPTPAGRKEVNE
jgi:hypothetical protein